MLIAMDDNSRVVLKSAIFWVAVVAILRSPAKQPLFELDWNKKAS